MVVTEKAHLVTSSKFIRSTIPHKQLIIIIKSISLKTFSSVVKEIRESFNDTIMESALYKNQSLEPLKNINKKNPFPYFLKCIRFGIS